MSEAPVRKLASPASGSVTLSVPVSERVGEVASSVTVPAASPLIVAGVLLRSVTVKVTSAAVDSSCPSVAT